MQPELPRQGPRDGDRTLPSLLAASPGSAEQLDLRLTILFHPDTRRIGQSAAVPVFRANAPWILGRNSPRFGDEREESGLALRDRYVSRQALQVEHHDNRVVLRRFEGSSRCRLAGCELSDSLELHEEQLRIGIPMMLGHSVVLLLKLCAVTRREAQVPGPWDELLGSGQSMRELRAQLALASACDLDVLLRGETGTGKELAARAIHQGSGRSGAPLVSVNMAAIPEELAPAALFGSARGSFTGADKSVSGYFQQADGGSLFLDEVGEAASAVQPQLLRALQQRDVQVVGGAIRKVDVRVISATDADLDSNEVAFRAALRHRLGSIEIDMPPLRDRLEDIGELMRHFMLCTASGESREDILPTPCSEPRNVAAWANLFFIFARYNWPGNVRELANSVRQVVLSAVDIPVLPAKFEVLLSRTSMPATAHAGVRDRKIADVDDAEFERAMMDNDYEVRRVALELGVSRASVYRRIESSARYRLATDIPLADLLHELAAHGGDVEAAARELRVSSRSLGQRLGKETAGRA